MPGDHPFRGFWLFTAFFFIAMLNRFTSILDGEVINIDDICLVADVIGDAPGELTFSIDSIRLC